MATCIAGSSAAPLSMLNGRVGQASSVSRAVGARQTQCAFKGKLRAGNRPVLPNPLRTPGQQPNAAASKATVPKLSVVPAVTHKGRVWRCAASANASQTTSAAQKPFGLPTPPEPGLRDPVPMYVAFGESGALHVQVLEPILLAAYFAFLYSVRADPRRQALEFIAMGLSFGLVEHLAHRLTNSVWAVHAFMDPILTLLGAWYVFSGGLKALLVGPRDMLFYAVVVLLSVTGVKFLNIYFAHFGRKLLGKEA